MPLTRAVAQTGTVVDQLPRRLLNFFARYPPEIYSARANPKPQPSADAILPQPAPNPYTADRAREAKERAKEERDRNNDPSINTWSSSEAFLRSNPEHPNPFLPYKNPETNRWRGPTVSLRRQAELVKIAAKYNVEELLPPGLKATEYKMTKLEEKGLRVRGTGVGQRVKGHKWERTLQERLDKRKQAMLEMPELIRQWKQVSLLLAHFSSFFSKHPLDVQVSILTIEIYSLATVVDGQNTPRNKLIRTDSASCFDNSCDSVYPMAVTCTYTPTIPLKPPRTKTRPFTLHLCTFMKFLLLISENMYIRQTSNPIGTCSHYIHVQLAMLICHDLIL